MKLKKVIASLTAAIMTFGACPITLFAEDSGNKSETTQNLITDGSFDTTTSFNALDWIFKNYNTWYSGGSIAIDEGNQYATVTNTGIGQNVEVEEGKTYTLTAKVKSTGTTSLCIQNGDANYPGTQPGNTLASVTVTGDEWHTVTLDYANETNIGHFFVYMWSGDGITTDIDDVTLVCNGDIERGSIDPTRYTAKTIWDANAGNPIIPGYIGDPFMFRDDDGTFYIYGTTDGYGTGGGDIEASGPYCVWYSKDMTNWKCKTFLYEDGTFPKTNEVLWAPSVTKASNGKYYMAYIWQGYNCYLAEADSPLGPWKDALDGEVVAPDMFDTDIVTIDGDTYVVTQGPKTNNKNTIYLGKFKDDMSGLDENGLQAIFNNNVFEAPGLFKENGKYYLTFANGSLGNGSYRVDYAMADNITGPYTNCGTILQKDGDIHTTGHSNCVKVGDDWYICYHRKILNGNYGYARQAAMEKVVFDADNGYKINVMKPTVNSTKPNLNLTVNDTNLAWENNVKMSASSTGTGSELGVFNCLPMYAADRNNGTLWKAENTTDAQWIMMDLGEEKEVGRIETFFEYHTVAYQYTIEYSKDGDKWTEFADKSNNKSLASPQVDSVTSPITARYIRISFPKGGIDLTAKRRANDYEEYTRTETVGIFEMNVYGTPASDKDENLIIDGGFDTTTSITNGNWWATPPDTGLWQYSGNGVSIDTDSSTLNKYVTVAGGSGLGQNIEVERGKKYTLTAKIKGGSATLSINDGTTAYPGGNKAVLVSKGITENSDWTTYTIEYTNDSYNKLFVYLWSDDGSNVYIDDVKVVGADVEFDGGGVVNGDFSEGSNGWIISNSDNMSVSDGKVRATGEDYETRISQHISGLENGVYTLNAYTSNDSIDGICYLYAKTAGHTMASTSVPISDSETKITVPGIIVEDGKCDIGLYVNGSNTLTLDRMSFTPCEETRTPLLKGGEISKLTYVEDRGGKFYDEDGHEGDALQIMAENGFNLARIRVLNNPGKGRGDDYYLPDGYQDLDDCLELARRAKDKGMQIEFTFAYSDSWSDGANQRIPYDWQAEIAEQGITDTEELAKYLEDKVYNYTKEVMQKLINQGTCPEYVSIGNEIQVGLFFTTGKNTRISAFYNNPNYLARFLKAGAQAVRDTSPESKIIVHSDMGGEVLTRRKTFVNALSQILDYIDVIGVSYYPNYSQSTSAEALVNEFNTMINRFDKDVIIMETGYNWTEFKPDGAEGQLTNSGYYQNIYGETQEGQRAFLTELYAKLKQTLGGRCIGDLYWDPVMIYDGGVEHNEPGKGIGWAVRESDDITETNVVPNSTIFDFTGKVVEGQKAMKYNTNANDKILITGTVTDGGEICKNEEITVTVNGTEYKTATDKYGKYIAAVDYPSNEKFIISAENMNGSYSIDAPNNGVLLRGIDFTTLNTEDKKCVKITAKYNVDGTLQDVKTEEINISDIEDITDTSTLKTFYWESMESMKPISK